METTTIISIGALIVASLGLILNSRKETRNDAAALAEIKASLNSVSNGVNEIRLEIRGMRETISNLAERVTRAEEQIESLKTHIKG